ncbi:MAG: MFS transporter [Pseudomonadota bacterium]
MSANRHLIRFINIGHTLDHVAVLIFPTAVLAMGPAFGLDYGTLLALSFGLVLAFGLGSIPAGWLGDRWSRRGMMAVFFIGMGLSLVLTGFATSPWMLAGALTLVGVFGSIYHPVGTALLVESADRVGRAIGTNAVFGNAGIAGAAVMTGALTAAFGWRAAFIVPGLICVGLGLAYLKLVPFATTAESAKGRPPGPPINRTDAIRALSALAITSIVTSFAAHALMFAAPKLIEERVVWAGQSVFWAGAAATFVLACGAIAQYSVGRTTDRYGVRLAFIPLALGLAPAIFITAFASGPMLLLGLALFAMASFGQVTVNDTIIARYTPDAWRGRAYAVRYLAAFGASSAAIPYLAGFHDQGGFQAAFHLMAMVALVVIVAAIIMPARRTDPAPALQPAE